MASCCGSLTGLKVEWYIQPTALLLSVKASMWGCSVSCSSWSSDSFIVTIAAMNSRRFIEARCWRCVGRRYLQVFPCEVNPPSPHSQASE